MKSTKVNRHGKVLKGKKPKEPAAPPATKPPPPPVPPSLLSRTPPPMEDLVAAEKAAIHARPKVGHPMPEPGDTHLEWRSVDGRVSVVCAVSGFGDFSSLPGTVRYGRLRYGDEFIPDNRYATAPLLAGTEAAVATQNPRPARAKSAGGKREGVCAFIDNLIMQGGKTAQEICDLACAQFPGRDASATLNTVKVRPSHMRRAGKVPPPFAK